MADDDIVIVKEEHKLSRTYAKWALMLSVGLVAIIAACGMTVLMWSFFHRMEAPAWATAVETAVMTAALALIFKDRSDGAK